MRKLLALWVLVWAGGCGTETPHADDGVDAGGFAGGDASGSGGASASGGTNGSTGGGNTGGLGGEASNFTLPPVNAGLDYQLGGPYEPPAGVGIVSRDRTAEPASGLYNICYVNGFQIQPNEEDFWLEQHPDLILRDAEGEPVIDEGWDEMLLDVGTQEKREAIAVIVGEWIAGCAADGFDAVEIDNLDSFSRSTGLLNEDDAVQAVRLFADAAHANALAIAQKNSAELVARKAEMATDFVVAEECNTWDECDVFTAAYGEHVLVIEYVEEDFEEGCTNFPGLSIVLRDRDLLTPGPDEYVYDGC